MPKVEIVNEQQVDEKEAKRLARKAEKEAKRQREYANSMITRAEAYTVAQEFAKRETQALAEFLREPLQVNLVQTMALVDILVAKGVFTQEEFQESLNKVAEKLQAQAQEGETVGKSETTETTEGSSTEEKEEQQG